MPRKDGCLALIILVAVHQASGSSIGFSTEAPRPCTEDEPMSAGSCWVIKCEGGYLSDFVTLRVSEECCQQPIHSDLCQSAYPVQSTTWYPTTMSTTILTTLPPTTTTTCPCEMKLYHHDICGQYAFCGDCYMNMQTLTVRDDSETLLCCTWTRSSRCLQLYPDLLTTTPPSSTPECQDSDTHINSDCYWMRCHDGKWQRPEPAMTEHCCSTYTYLPERCAIGIYETEPIMTTTTSTPSPTTTTVTEPTTTLPTTKPCPCEMKLYHHDICGQYAFCGDCYMNMQTLTVRDDSETLLCCTWTRSSRCLQLYPDLLTTTPPSSTPECQDSDTHINSDCYWMRCHDGKWQRPEPAMTEHCCSTYTYLPERCAIGIYETEPIMTTTTSTPSPTTTTVTEPTTTLPTTKPCPCEMKLYHHDICGQYAFCGDCYMNMQTLTVRDDSETLLCCTWTRSSRCLQLYPDLLTTTPPSSTPECQDSDTHINSDCYWMRCHDGKWQRPEPAMTEHCCSTYTYLPERCAIGIYETEPIMTTTTSTPSPTTTTVTEPTTTLPTTKPCPCEMKLYHHDICGQYAFCGDCYMNMQTLTVRDDSETLLCCTWTRSSRCLQLYPDLLTTTPPSSTPECQDSDTHINSDCYWMRCHDGKWQRPEPAMTEHCCSTYTYLPERCAIGIYETEPIMTTTTSTPSPTTTTVTEPTTTLPTTKPCPCEMKLYHHDICGQYAFCGDCYMNMQTLTVRDDSETLLCCTWTRSSRCLQLYPDLLTTTPPSSTPECQDSDTHINSDCYWMRCHDGKWQRPEPAMTEHCCSTYTYLPERCAIGIYETEPITTTTTSTPSPTTTTVTEPTTTPMCSGNGLLQQGYSHCWDLYCVSGNWATQPSLTLTCCEEFVMHNSPWSQDCYNTFPELYLPRCTSDEVNGCAYRKCWEDRLMDLVWAVISEYCCQPENRLDWAYSDGGCDELYPPPCTTDEIGHHCTYRKCVGGRLMSLFYPVISEYCCRPENIAYQGFTNGYSDTTCEEMFPSTTTVVYATAVTSYPTPADFTRDPSSGQMYPCTENEIQAGGCYEKMCVNRYLSDVLVPIYNMDCCSNVLNSHDECYVSFPGLYTSTSTTAAATTTNEDVPEADALTG
ncbi:mucin-2-like isoform X2 [Haliotis cracherodii]|uniref:mucin-2-like isoform X2 n=1 Tax=Haliotis cracherodii TaxID=6455 RepID=UPI0039EBE545